MSYDPTSLAGVPDDAKGRLAQNKAGLFTSDLSVNEFLLVKQAGLRPGGPGGGKLDLPHRLSAIELEPKPGDGRSDPGHVPRPRAGDDPHGRRSRAARRRRHRRGETRYRPLRMGRRSGRVHRHRHRRSSIATASFTAHRTAARSPPTSPARSSGRCSLRVPPGGYVMGSCVYHVAHQGLREFLKQTGQNVEMTNYTQALYDARELAMSADAGRGRGGSGRRHRRRSADRALHGWGST